MATDKRLEQSELKQTKTTLFPSTHFYPIASSSRGEEGLWWAKSWERKAKKADQRFVTYHTTLCSAIKAQGKEESERVEGYRKTNIHWARCQLLRYKHIPFCQQERSSNSLEWVTLFLHVILFFATVYYKLSFRSNLKALQETMWQMKRPAMSCFFCVMLLFQIAHAGKCLLPVTSESFS